jgi:hypothetical protein
MIHGMTDYAKIIVESDRPNHWVAWLEMWPRFVVGGELPDVAIRRLFTMYSGDAVFDHEGMSSIDDATGDGHLEFLIAFEQPQKTPRASKK